MMLDGGLKPGFMYLLYGEAGTGKTTLAIQLAVNAAMMNLKSIFVDSESSFSMERLSQISGSHLNKISPLILIIQPESFEMQSYFIDHLHEYLTGRVGLIIFDTITSLYRLELGGKAEAFALNRELNRQLAFIADAVKGSGAAAMLTAQVRQRLSGTVNSETLEPVATRILNYWSDVVIRLNRSSKSGIIHASIEKGLKRGELSVISLKICEDGIHSL